MEAPNYRAMLKQAYSITRPIWQTCLHFSILALSLLIFVVVLEILAQAYFIFFPSATLGVLIDLDGYGHHPYVETSQRPNTVINKDHFMWRYWQASCNKGCCEDGVAMRTNSLGFRAREFSSFGPKEENEVRVILSGGSVPMGAGHGMKCTLSAELIDKLSEAYPGKKITLINLSNGAWKSFQELIAIQRYGLDLEPDLVIAFSGAADFIHTLHNPPYVAYGSGQNRRAFALYERKYTDNFRFFKEALKLPELLNLLSKSLFETFNPYKYLKEKIPFNNPNDTILKSESRPASESTTRKDLNYPIEAEAPTPPKLFTRASSFPVDLTTISKRKDFSPYSEYVGKVFSRNMEMMAYALTPLSGKLFVVLSPMLYAKQTPSEAEVKNFWNIYARESNFALHSYLNAKANLSQGELNIPNLYVMDGNDSVKNIEGHIFGDSAHLTDLGISRVSEAVVSEIVRREIIEEDQE